MTMALRVRTEAMMVTAADYTAPADVPENVPATSGPVVVWLDPSSRPRAATPRSCRGAPGTCVPPARREAGRPAAVVLSGHMNDRAWQHPWLRIHRLVRSILEVRRDEKT